MRLVVSLIFLLAFHVGATAKTLSNHLEIPPMISPNLTLSMELSPHNSTFYFEIPHGDNEDLPASSSTSWTPLLRFKLETRSQFVNVSYSLETTFPMNPGYNVYDYSSAIINKSNFREWTHIAGFKLNISRTFKLGFAYHHRSTAFKANKLEPTTNFEFQLRNQNNLLITIENLFTVNHFLIKPSVRYSVHKWSGFDNNFIDQHFSRNTDHLIPINQSSFYMGGGLMLGSEKIAENFRLNLRYEDHDNFVIRTNRFLFGIQYKFNAL